MNVEHAFYGWVIRKILGSGGCLENILPVKGCVGSNPTPSAIYTSLVSTANITDSKPVDLSSNLRGRAIINKCMKIRFVYGVLPVFVFYPKVENATWSAKMNGPVIRIREFQDDEGVLQHEMTHVKQFYRTFCLHSFLYLLNQKYRFKAEVEAFRKQLEFDPEDKKESRRKQYANLLATAYRLDDVTVEKALDALK